MTSERALFDAAENRSSRHDLIRSAWLVFPLALIAGCAGGAGSDGARDEQAGLTGSEGRGRVEGRVTIGPLCPVEQFPPDPSCRPTPATYAAVKILVEAPSGEILREVALDDEGRYTVDLEPGSYLIDTNSHGYGIGRGEEDGGGNSGDSVVTGGGGLSEPPGNSPPGPPDTTWTVPPDTGWTVPPDSGWTAPIDSGWTIPTDSGWTAPGDSGWVTPGDSGWAAPGDSGGGSPTEPEPPIPPDTLWPDPADPAWPEPGPGFPPPEPWDGRDSVGVEEGPHTSLPVAVDVSAGETVRIDIDIDTGIR
ncbi:MAG: hypothetical protein H0V09_00775 [Gemmatimonadetes bacterium]|nr:hypothetical protein [Gemmatimonadota bacterium]